MAEIITMDDAGRRFAEVLRDAAAGKEFVVTRNGVPVARVVPETVVQQLPDGRRQLTAEQEAALARTMERLSVGWPLGIEKFNREEIYDDARDWMKRLK
jgi:prevent-host-death family protein